MPMIHDSPPPRSHRERIGATIRKLEGTIQSNSTSGRVLQAQVSPLLAPHTTGTETPKTEPTALEKYLEENSDEEGVVVFTRSCWTEG